MEFCIHDTGTVLKIPFILDRNLAKANCTEDRVCMSCNKVVLGVTQTEKKNRRILDVLQSHIPYNAHFT